MKAEPNSPAAAKGRIRVAICDDSATIRSALRQILDGAPDLVVVANLRDGRAAVAEAERRRTEEPIEVLLLDIDMPVMDGLTALPLLMRADPEMRILVVSTATTRGGEVALAALQRGAADFVAKPSKGFAATVDVFRAELIAKVRGQGALRRRGHRPAPAAPVPEVPDGRPALLAIGASTGGPQALFTLIGGLGRLPVPVVLTQHMPATFTPTMARHLGQLGPMPCAEAQDGQVLRPGEIVIAPGDHHLLIGRRDPDLHASLGSGPPEHYCRPAVDPMLRSAAACAGRVLVVMLTGMGQDGLAGTMAVIEAGGLAIAQDQASSVVWGMPGAIAAAGLCHAVLPLPDIAGLVRRLVGMPGA